MKFSVLMSIYHKEDSKYFERCMQSIWCEQSIKPTQIVLVKDGPLTPLLDEVITKWSQKLVDILTVIPLSKNVGLGQALNIGLEACEYPLVARMDTDDIAKPYRFERQIKLFMDEHLDICSSWVGEFDDNESEIVSCRKLPETHEEIVSYIKYRSPINHPAVMFLKDSVVSAGGYQHMLGFEDYYLWARMMKNGAIFHNICEPLVDMRAGYGQLERRGGWNYAINEVKFQFTLYKLGLINILELIRNVTMRFTIRLLPKKGLKMVYKLLRKHK